MKDFHRLLRIFLCLFLRFRKLFTLNRCHLGVSLTLFKTITQNITWKLWSTTFLCFFLNWRFSCLLFFFFGFLLLGYFTQLLLFCIQCFLILLFHLFLCLLYLLFLHFHFFINLLLLNRQFIPLIGYSCGLMLVSYFCNLDASLIVKCQIAWLLLLFMW